MLRKAVKKSEAAFRKLTQDDVTHIAKTQSGLYLQMYGRALRPVPNDVKIGYVKPEEDMTKKPTIASLQADLKENIEMNIEARQELRQANEHLQKELHVARNQIQQDQGAYGVKIQSLNDRLKEEIAANNHLRSILHQTELELSRMRGYLDCVQDGKPPVMVPEQREARLASYPEGNMSMRSTVGGWNDGQKTKQWFER